MPIGMPPCNTCICQCRPATTMGFAERQPVRDSPAVRIVQGGEFVENRRPLTSKPRQIEHKVVNRKVLVI